MALISGLKSPLAVAFMCALGVVAPLSVARAQTASQVTPPTFRPPVGSGGVAVGTPEQAPLRAPAEASDLFVTLGSVRVDGLFAEVATEAQRILRNAKGRRLSVTQLYEIATAIEQLHVAAGFVLARVVVPQQEVLDGGTFIIEVIDGFVEAVEADGLPERVREPVRRRVESLVGARHITLAEIERRVLLAGDVPGVQLSSTLARGTKRGGTRLVLQAVYNPVQGTLVSDNRLNSALNTWQHTASLSANSVLGLGETVYGTIAGSGDLFKEESRLKMYAAGMVLPIGNDGLTFNPEYTLTRSTPVPAAGAPATDDRFERFAARLSYPFIRTRAVTLTGQTSYEHISQQSEALAFSTLLNLDRYDVMRNTLQATLGNGAGGSLLVNAQLSTGLTGRSQADATAERIPLSRQNAGPQFSKMSGDVIVSQMLPGDVRLQVSARGQASNSGPLLKPEQLSLDSSDILTGWAAGTFLVDQGAAGRAELSRRFEFANAGWLKVATPYVFAAGGRGQLLSATAVEVNAVTATSLGFGVRGALDLPGNRLGGFTALELAKRYTDDPNRPEGWRGVVSFGVKF